MKSRTIFYLSCALLFLLYLGYQSRAFLFGPELSLPYPSIVVTSEKTFTLKGETSPQNKIFIDNQEVSTDGQGNFSLPLALRDGVNDIILTAQNRFQKETSKTIRIIVKRPHSFNNSLFLTAVKKRLLFSLQLRTN